MNDDSFEILVYGSPVEHLTKWEMGHIKTEVRKQFSKDTEIRFTFSDSEDPDFDVCIRIGELSKNHIFLIVMSNGVKCYNLIVGQVLTVNIPVNNLRNFLEEFNY